MERAIACARSKLLAARTPSPGVTRDRQRQANEEAFRDRLEPELGNNRRTRSGGTIVSPKRFLHEQMTAGQNARCVMPYLFWMVLPFALWDAFTHQASHKEDSAG